MAKGKIIAIVGASGSGKSFLAKKLQKNLNAIAFLEGETNTIPKRIQENFSKEIRNLETIIWFRNRTINNFLKAQKLKAGGKTVVLDTFWITPYLYVNTMLDGFEKQLMAELRAIDQQFLDYPNLVIFLKMSKKNIRRHLKRRGRRFDQKESYIRRILSVNQEHQRFFKNQYNGKYMIIDKDNLDFAKKQDFDFLLKKIKKAIKKK